MHRGPRLQCAGCRNFSGRKPDTRQLPFVIRISQTAMGWPSVLASGALVLASGSPLGPEANRAQDDKLAGCLDQLDLILG